MPNLMWTWSRLRQMDVAEIRHRVADAARTVWEGLAVSHRWPDCPDACARLLGVRGTEEVLVQFRERLAGVGKPVPGADAQLFVTTVDSPGARRIIQEAENVLNHRIRLFGKLVEFGEEIDWHRDFGRGQSISRSFYGRLDYRDPRKVGEVKLTWELNRHQHLLRLAQAYQFTQDARYLRELFEQIESWAIANPPLRGVNWTRPLELGLRLLAWTWALAAVGDVETIASDRWMRVFGFAAVQWRFLKEHFSYGSSANNHLLGELLGAAWAGAFLFSEVVAGKVVRQALRWLFAEIDRQVYPDGVSRELSVYYHAYVLLYGLLGLVLARRLGVEVPAATQRRLHKMGKFLLAVYLGDGVFPLLGDDDGGHILPLAPRPNLPADALDLWSTLFGESLPDDLRGPLGLSWWLSGLLTNVAPQFEKLGRPGMKAEIPVRSEPDMAGDSQLLVFPKAGYAVLRKEAKTGSTVLIFDAGPLGDDKLAAHGHADALSLVWTVEGEEILADPGTYAYDGDPVWRNAFRGTPAHNTVTVDGQWQSRPGGTFLWLRRARAHLLDVFEREGIVYLQGEHEGYSDLGVTHRRTVLKLGERMLVVRDELEGRGRHGAEQRFHFPDGVLHWYPGRKTIRVDLTEHVVWIVPQGWTFEVEAHRMAGPEEGGWVSRRFGTREPALTVVLHYQGQLPSELTTLLIVQGRSQVD